MLFYLRDSVQATASIARKPARAALALPFKRKAPISRLQVAGGPMLKSYLMFVHSDHFPVAMTLAKGLGDVGAIPFQVLTLRSGHPEEHVHDVITSWMPKESEFVLVGTASLSFKAKCWTR